MKSPSSLLLALGLLAAACGSGGGAGGSGQISLVLTDAASDQLSQFEVDVGNVVFRKLGGREVSVMPRATRVDFVELESLSELVTTADLEAGTYTGVTMTLDFTEARVVIDQATTPATVVDRNGNAITGELEVSVAFPTSQAPSVGIARRHLFVLDLDLDQSITVDVAANRVTFAPVLNAEIDPEQSKPITTTGVLLSIAPDVGTFTVERRAREGDAMSTFTVRVADTTVFQIDGIVHRGAAGLAALAGHEGERLFVQGTIDGESDELAADAVEAGAGVPGNGQDWVLGHVVARTGAAGADPSLTVLGRSFDVATGTRTWNTQFTANLSLPNTKVLRRGAEQTLSTDAINVGQLVWLFGDLTATTLDVAATDGVARLLRTSIFGVVTGTATTDVLTLDVSRFDLRAASLFDFEVAGQIEADPEAFTVDVTGLSTEGIASGSRLRVFGWLNPVGVVGDENATAVAVVDRGTGPKVLVCQWDPPSTSAILANQEVVTEITLDVADADIRVVVDGFSPVTLNVTPLPRLRALLGFGCYRIIESGHIELFTNFVAFRQAVLERGSAPVFRITSFGTFDATTQVFSALTATVVFDG